MAYEVLTKQFEDIKVMYIPKTVSQQEFKNIRSSFDTVASHVLQNGGKSVGSFMLYHECNDEIMNVDCCIMVTTLLPESDDIKAKIIGGGEYLVACGVHKGAYSGISEAWNEFITWILSEGYSLVDGPPFWEIYLNSPMDVDEKDLLTQLIVPVAKQ
jgi:effector-binding domain-containing protein